jgi:hypothetical protein
MLVEQLDYDLLFRWFVGWNVDDAIWDVAVFFQPVMQQARDQSLRRFPDE